MGIDHAVHGLATGVLRGGDFPVAILLKLLADAGNHRTEVLHAELALSLSRGQSLAHTKVVDDLTGLVECGTGRNGLGGSCHNENLLRDCLL